jgi:hypothetical protein
MLEELFVESTDRSTFWVDDDVHVHIASIHTVLELNMAAKEAIKA